MIVPYMKRVVYAVHDKGMGINFHICLCIGEKLVPAMIEAGVDLWCGQPMNNYKEIYDQHGKEFNIGVRLDPPTTDASFGRSGGIL